MDQETGATIIGCVGIIIMTAAAFLCIFLLGATITEVGSCVENGGQLFNDCLK